MATPETRRHELYTGLTQVLGLDLTERLMSYLPTSPGIDMATKGDIAMLRTDVDELRTELRAEMSGLRAESHRDFTALGQRIDRLQLTLIAGFFAVVATLVATGLLA